jgi:hypothetical protein
VVVFKFNYSIYIFKNQDLKKNYKKRGSKVFPKSKNGQKKCPKKCPAPFFGENSTQKLNC